MQTRFLQPLHFLSRPPANPGRCKEPPGLLDNRQDEPQLYVTCAFVFFVHGWSATSGVAQWSACWAHNPKVPGSKPGSARIWAHKDPHLPWAFPHTHADAAPAAAPLPLLATGKPQQVQGTTGLRGQPATRTAAVGHMCFRILCSGLIGNKRSGTVVSVLGS